MGRGSSGIALAQSKANVKLLTGRVYNMERSLHGRAASASRLYACGFNAHGQLKPGGDAHLTEFVQIRSPDDDKKAYILFAGWSQTVLHDEQNLWGNGHGDNLQLYDPESYIKVKDLHSGFGNHEGMLGALDKDCVLWVVMRETGMLVGQGDPVDSPPLFQVAVAGNGKVAITLRQAPNARLTHILEFTTFERFKQWYEDPGERENYPDGHHMVGGKAKQLIANATTFTLLTEAGEVYTYGDPRHQTLGRPTTGDGAVGADKPGTVEALGGLNVIKIASSGWMTAALSEDGALYLLGSGTPGTEQSLKCLRGLAAGEVALVDLPGNGEEPLDVLDVAVGAEHVAAVTQDGRLFVVGSNSNGQLGLGTSQQFYDDWVPVSSLNQVSKVVCGPRSTFVSTDSLNLSIGGTQR